MTGFRAIYSVPLILILCGFLVAIVYQTQQGRHPCRYLIPEGYVGWVRVDYQIKGAPELPIEDGYRVYKFPNSGRLQTSSAFEVGTYADLISGLKDEYYYYSSDTRRQLPAGANGADGGMIWHHGRGESGGGKARGRIVGRDNQSEAMEIKIKESYEYFFVGTEEEYKTYGTKGGDIHDPKIGPVKSLPLKTNL
jgi:hypothetical protein